MNSFSRASSIGRAQFKTPVKSRPLGGALKRALDISGALFGIVLFAPLLAICAVAVILSSPGPLLFRQRRVGFDGRMFSCLKFRTMVADAEARLQIHLQNDAEANAEWQATRKLKNDPRISPMGQMLRRTSLDELPQLLNVLRGDMSLVGPRPIVEGEIEKYKDKFGEYTATRPGLTGLWQISGRNNTTYDERVAYDVRYAQNWSFLKDIEIIALTIPHLLGSDGAY